MNNLTPFEASENFAQNLIACLALQESLDQLEKADLDEQEKAITIELLCQAILGFVEKGELEVYEA